jgi:ribosomal protein L37AE/L43A
MNDPAFTDTVETLLDILGDLDEYDTPKVKLPNCPKCDEDELGVIHAELVLCYNCGWKIEGKR